MCVGAGSALKSQVYAFGTQAMLSALGLENLPCAWGPGWVGHWLQSASGGGSPQSGFYTQDGHHPGAPTLFSPDVLEGSQEMNR